jgi:pyridoxine kinase
MSVVLNISSQVVRGHVGLSATIPALRRLGHEVWPVPTILLSNHPGHSRAVGGRVEANTLDGMIEALEANGWLKEVHAVLTGYCPSAQHVGVCVKAIARVRERNPEALVFCDPVLGDDPKGLYIDAEAAEAIRDRLLPMATHVKPNRFELSWLSGHDVREVRGAMEAAESLGVGTIIATSIPVGPDRIANVMYDSVQNAQCIVRRRLRAPQGTGDLLSALFLGHLLNGQTAVEALGRSVAGVDAALVASDGRDELVMSAPQTSSFVTAPATTVELF